MILLIARHWRIGVALALALALVAMFAWARHEKTLRGSAEAELAKTKQELEVAQKSIKDLQDDRERIEKAMFDRDVERTETQERLRSASAELTRLRRQNEKLREWLDRPIPDDVVRLLKQATGGDPDRKAVPASNPAR